MDGDVAEELMTFSRRNGRSTREQMKPRGRSGRSVLVVCKVVVCAVWPRYVCHQVARQLESV